MTGPPKDIATERFMMLVPLLDKNLDKKAEVQKRQEIAEAHNLDERTLRRWKEKYERDGFAGLVPKTRGRPRATVIDQNALSYAISLRLEVPTRSVETIIDTMENEGIVERGTIKRSTLQDALERAGYSASQMRIMQAQKTSPVARRFEHHNRNDSWQSDVKFGPDIGGQPTYLISFLDDHSRYLLHSEFYPAQNLDPLLHCFREAVGEYGVPDQIQLDNGQIYRSNQLRRICAQLGCKVTFCAPYNAQAKGKIERFHRTVDAFLAEIALEQPDNIETLNDRYRAWIFHRYHNKAHSALDGKTPQEVYDADPKPLRVVTSEALREAFLYEEERKVDKAGCISFQSRRYAVEAGMHLVGRRVKVLYDPHDISVLTIRGEDFPDTTATPLVMHAHVGAMPKPAPIPEPAHEPRPSPVLNAAQAAYERDVAARLAAKKQQGTNTGEAISPPMEDAGRCDTTKATEEVNPLAEKAEDTGNDDKNEAMPTASNPKRLSAVLETSQNAYDKEVEAFVNAISFADLLDLN